MSSPSTIKALGMLRSAIVNARIYPSGSQMVESALKGAHENLQESLRESTELVIADVQGKLCVNGKEVPEAFEFIAFLGAHNIRCLKILKGLLPSEVNVIVEGLGRKKDGFGDKPSIIEWIKTQNVPHVRIEELEYVAIQQGDVVVKQIYQLIDQTQHDTPLLMQSIEQSMALIEKLPDLPARQQAKRQLASRLSQVSPQQLKDVFEMKLSPSVEQTTLKDDIVAQVSREKLEETMEEVNKWYQDIHSQGLSEFEVMDKLAGLKGFLRKILHSPASKMVSFALYEEMLNIGLLDDLPLGVQKTKPSVLVQAEQLVVQPAANLIEPAIRQQYPEMLKALCAMEQTELFNRLAEKVLENLKSSTPLVRDTTVKTVRIFQTAAAANRKEKTFMTLVMAMLGLSESESVSTVYVETVSVLQSAVQELMVNWHFEEAASILATFRRHARDESPIGQKKHDAARKAIKEFSKQCLEMICADLNSSSKERQLGAQKVLSELGEDAVDPLLESLKRSSDVRVQQSILVALENIGTSVRGHIAKHLTPDISVEAFLHLLPACKHFMDVAFIPPLLQLLNHPHVDVRKGIAELGFQLDDTKLQPVMQKLLDDSDVGVQSIAIRWFGERQQRSFADDLAKRLPRSLPAAQEEICLALGRLGDSKVVPMLVKLFEKQGLVSRKYTYEESVRLRAIWALGQFSATSEARKMLSHLQKDSNPTIQRAALNVLQKASA